MTQILGTLKDSGANPITGKLVVVLAGSLIDDATSPDTIYLPQAYTFPVTAGVINITLPQSETSRITYNFQFFKTDTEGELIEPALLNFNAIVPNVSPVEWSSLLPTGIVNDVLDTGALRVARLISTTPALAQSIGGPFPRGAYSPTTTYKFRDLVTYLNRTYISKDLNPITGVVPTNTTSWMVIPVEPNGSLILADDTPYSSAWNGSGKSASQDAVYDQVEDVKSSVALKANLISPIFSGDVIVPNQTLGDASTKAANTNFVAAGLADNITTVNTSLALKSPLASPTFTGTPSAPTASTSTNTTQIATTAFVKSNLTSYATLVSPTFTGAVVVPSQTANDNSTKAANTSYVDTGLSLKANLASPTFTGDPKAPSPAASDNDTSIATTEHVKNAIALSFGWNSLSLANSYAAVSALQYSKHPSGIVFIRGSLTCPVVNDNTTIATLPSGNRPAVAMIFIVPCNTNTVTTVARITVQTSGDIVFSGNVTSGGTSITLLHVNLSFNNA